MGSPVDFPESNMTFSKPESMTNDECQPLPAFVDGQQIISCWELTEEEIMDIVRTKKVWLSVVGGSQPPVCIFGFYPFDVKEEVPENKEGEPDENS